MALQLGAGTKGEDWRRSDMFHVDPTRILVREDLRGRRYPPSEEAIIRRAVSFYRYGQLQPCVVRLISHAGATNVPLLSAGFTRTAAARLLREGFVVPDDFEEEALAEAAESQVPPVKAGDFIQVAEFMLQIRHTKCNEKEALIHNIVENNERDATSDIDDAHNQERLRRDHGFSNAEIARLYNYGAGGQNKVSRLSRLLELPDPIQLRVHLGEIPTQAALELLESGRPQEQWEDLLAESTSTTGKVVAAKLRDTVRDHQLADFEDANQAAEAAASGTCPVTGTKPEPPKTKPRSMANVKKLVDSVINGEWDNVDPATVALMRKVKQYLAGRLRDETLLKAFGDHLESEPAEEEAMRQVA
jgi:ParB-like chromosome segregation protein Spo0J